MKGKSVIFVSLPEIVNRPGKAQGLRDCIFEAIRSSGRIPFDGFSNPHELDRGRADEIFARMWRANAGIFLAVGDAEPQWLTPNQEIEWGFMRPLCERTIIVCHPQTLPRRRFMMPDELMITYDDLNSRGDYLRVKEEIERLIKRWFGGSQRNP